MGLGGRLSKADRLRGIKSVDHYIRDNIKIKKSGYFYVIHYNIICVQMFCMCKT